MANPLTAAGAVAAPSKSAPLLTDRFFSGLWTQRSPLRGVVAQIYEKFYGGSRFDHLLDGHDCELTSRLTLARRPGHTVYNSQSWAKVLGFYEFKRFIGGAEKINMIVDADDGVYDGTGPSTKQLLKAKKTKPALATAAGGALAAGRYYVVVNQPGDDNSQNVTAENSIVVAASGILKVTLPASGSNQPFTVYVGMGSGQEQFPFTFAPSLGGTQQSITTLAGAVPALPPTNRVVCQSVGNILYAGGQSPFKWLANAGVWAAAQAYTVGQFIVDANFNLQQVTTAGTSGGGVPAFSVTARATTADNTVVWTNRGPAVATFGIAAPTVTPTLAQALAPNPYHNWAANTWYSPIGLFLVDSNNNIELLTTGGTLSGAEPAWSVVVGGTTNDNTAVWTMKGPKGWVANHVYAVGDVVQIDYSVTVLVPGGDSGGDVEPPIRGGGGAGSGGHTTFTLVTTNYSDFFQVVTAGTSGGTAPGWTPGAGAQVNDNTVGWKNAGVKATWATFGAAAKLSLDTVIVDSNLALQQVSVKGISGGGAPAWATVIGNNTVDNTVVWVDQGPFSAANTGNWFYAYSFFSSITKHASTASPVSVGIIQAASKMIVVSGGTTSDPLYDKIRIWRTTQQSSASSPSVLLFVADVDMPATGSTWNFNDTNPDRNLNTLLQAPLNGYNDPPPSQVNGLEYHVSRLFGFSGNVVSYTRASDASTSGVSVECWTVGQTFVYPSLVIRLKKTAIGLLVFTVDDTYIIKGLGTLNSPFYTQPYMEGVGIKSYDALTVNAATLYLLTSDGRQLMLDPGAGLLETGFPIGDLLGKFAPQTAYLTWHLGGSGDSALYVGDGGSQWFRMAMVSPPETGLAWSPKAQLAQSAIASVEVQPGTRKLLVGPPQSVPGPILQRDPAVNTDNGVQYSWSATAGSLTLAQPGQLADIEFITLESVRVGTAPVVNVLLGEIAATAAVPFEALAPTRQDPPELAPSQTLFADRYYLDQDANPTLCRHLQVRFDYAAEDAATELLTYTIFGSVQHEGSLQ